MPKKLPRFIYGYLSDEEVSTVFFAGLLGSLVIVIPVIYLLIKQEFFPDANVKTYDSLITSLSFFIAGFIGIVYIIRKEFPFFIVV